MGRSKMAPSYDLRECALDDVKDVILRNHGYASVGSVAVHAFGVFEEGQVVAGFVWLPPPPGATVAVCPEAPHGVLALSRMAAVPRSRRRLNHISKPLRRQMRALIDRTRWPVLVTYHDEGQGHCGHVYKCSGWTPTARNRRRFYVSGDGARVSSYNAGRTVLKPAGSAGWTWLQRWEHWACERGDVQALMASGGWQSVSTGRYWRSGAPAMSVEKVAEGHAVEQLVLFAEGA